MRHARVLAYTRAMPVSTIRRMNVKPRSRSGVRRVFSLASLLLATATCVRRPSLARLENVPAVSDDRTKFHTRDGRLFVMTSYRVDADAVRGSGSEYDADRVFRRQGAIVIPRGEVALVETTHMVVDPGMTALAIMSAGSAVGTAICIAMPKACFGSCPTFYVPGANGSWRLQAEGFSTSIARSIAADDLDSLQDAHPENGSLELAMRNEALETHVVQRLSLQVVNAPAGSTVVRTHDEHFAAVGPTSPPTACAGTPDGCTSLLARDGREFTPGSDGRDLATRTDLVLQFAAPHARDVGIVLTLRNSLMSTFVLYHLIALHGRHYGEFMAALERRDLGLLLALDGFDRALGEIEVSVRQGSGGWHDVGEVRYVGPIALGVRALPARVSDPDAPYEVRLHYARSHWRFEAIAAGPLVARDLPATEVWPTISDPGRFARTDVLEAIHGRGVGLSTQPGDEVRFRFEVPPSDGAQGLFLRTHGYYYEWMRREWLRDENLPRARMLMENPREALRTLAPEFRDLEPHMDAIFEASRFTRQAPTP